VKFWFWFGLWLSEDTEDTGDDPKMQSTIGFVSRGSLHTAPSPPPATDLAYRTSNHHQSNCSPFFSLKPNPHHLHHQSPPDQTKMGSGLSQTAQTDPVYQEALAKISEAFDTYDKNNDGILSKREFLAIVNENLPDNNSSNTITDEDKEQWFVSLDRNNDGVIDRNEFMQWWTGNSDTTSKRAKGLDAVRTKLANKKGNFKKSFSS
jgi:calmodulin